MKTKLTAYEEWANAGKQFAIESRESGKAIVELGEAAFRYAASKTWCPHSEIIRRAFREGYFSKVAHEN